MSAWGDMGATWGDGPPERTERTEPTIRVPIQVTAADLADPDAFGARLEAALDAADPGGTLPVTIRTEVGPAAAAGPPRLERTLADLRQSLERWHRGDVSSLGVVEATRAYLDALDAGPEEADTS